MPKFNYVKWVFIIAVLFLTSCFPLDDESKPFEMYFSLGSQGGASLKAGDKFDLVAIVKVVRPVKNVKITVIIPKEIEVDHYSIGTMSDPKKGFDKSEKFPANQSNIYEWKGDLAPDGLSFWWQEWTWSRPVKAKHMSLYLKTKTEGAQWSAPIKAKIELDYKKNEDDRGSIGSIESGHYIEEFTGTHEAWGSGKK